MAHITQRLVQANEGECAIQRERKKESEPIKSYLVLAAVLLPFFLVERGKR